MKVSDLEGAALDYWVAKSAGLTCEIRDGRVVLPEEHGQSTLWRPSVDWSQAGPIIEREWISLTWTGLHHTAPHPHVSLKRGSKAPFIYGRTQLEAAMRAFVADKIGTEVPDEVVV